MIVLGTSSIKLCLKKLHKNQHDIFKVLLTVTTISCTLQRRLTPELLQSLERILFFKRGIRLRNIFWLNTKRVESIMLSHCQKNIYFASNISTTASSKCIHLSCCNDAQSDRRDAVTYNIKRFRVRAGNCTHFPFCPSAAADHYALGMPNLYKNKFI